MIEVRFAGSVEEVVAEMSKFVPAQTHGASAEFRAAKLKEKKEVVAEKEPAPETKSTKVTLQDIKEIIPKVVDKIGKAGIIKMLDGPGGKFGAKKGSELKEEHYEEFMKLAKESLA